PGGVLSVLGLTAPATPIDCACAANGMSASKAAITRADADLRSMRTSQIFFWRTGIKPCRRNCYALPRYPRGPLMRDARCRATARSGAGRAGRRNGRRRYGVRIENRIMVGEGGEPPAGIGQTIAEGAIHAGGAECADGDAGQAGIGRTERAKLKIRRRQGGTDRKIIDR